MEQHSWRELFRIGGAAQVIAGLLYLALVVILIQVGGLPTNGAALLHDIASKTALMQSTMILFIVIDLCLITATFPALFLALKEANRAWSLIATVLAEVSLLLDIIEGLVVYSLPAFATSYVAAPSTVQPTYVIIADQLYRYIWTIQSPFEVILLSLAVLIFSLVMLKGPFQKFTAVGGMVLGAIGMVGGFLGHIEPLLLLLLWHLATGIQMYRLGSSREKPI
jgi:hypothetical protein